MSFSDYRDHERMGDSHAEHMVARYTDEFLTAAVNPSQRPTLAELVPQYVAVGITPRNAVFYVVDSHMRSVVSRGKGGKAARRATQLLYARADAVGRDVEALNERVARNRRQWAADEAAEHHAESRRFKALDNIVNFHE